MRQLANDEIWGNQHNDLLAKEPNRQLCSSSVNYISSQDTLYLNA